MATKTSENEPVAGGIINTLPDDSDNPSDRPPEQTRPQNPEECLALLNDLFPQFKCAASVRSASPADPQLDMNKAEVLRDILKQIDAEKLLKAGLLFIEIYSGDPERDGEIKELFWYSLTATRAQNLEALCAAYNIPIPEAHAAEDATRVGHAEPLPDDGDTKEWTGYSIDPNAAIIYSVPEGQQKEIRRWIRLIVLAAIVGAATVAVGTASLLKSRETEKGPAAVSTPRQVSHDCRVRMLRLSSGKEGFKASCDITREQGIKPGFEWTSPVQTLADGTRTQLARITIKVPDLDTGELKEICVTTNPVSVKKGPGVQVGQIQQFPATKFTCDKAPQ